MSRSYKKNPVHKYAPERARWAKNQANRRVRRYKGDLSDGCDYKRLYNPWDIHDCISYETYQMALDYREEYISDCALRGRTCDDCWYRKQRYFRCRYKTEHETWYNWARNHKFK